MSQYSPDSDDLSELRSKTEEKLRQRSLTDPVLPSTREDMIRLIHDLSVHQLELELQQEELIESREKLEQSLNRYTELYDFSPVGYLTISRDSKILEGNLTAAKMLCENRSWLVNKYFINFITLNDRAVFTELIEKVFSKSEDLMFCEIQVKKENFHPEIKITDSDNGERLSVRIDAILDSNKENCLLAITDISMRINAARDLIASFEHQRLILEETHAGSWEWDTITNKNIWSEGLWQLYGLEPWHREPSYDLWKESIVPEERLAKEMVVQHAVSQGISFSIEWRVHNLAGEERWLMSKGIPFEDKDGLVIRYAGIVVDITELKRAEAIGKSEQQFSRSVINSIPGAFYIIDANGHFKSWNATLRDEIVGKTDGEMLNTPFALTIHPQDRALIQKKFINVIDHGVEEHAEARILLRGGPEFRWFLLTGIKCIIDETVSLIGTGVDITEQKQAEEENAKLESQLLQSQKMEMLGTLAGGIAHDFNNMLGVILGYTEMLLDGRAPSDAIYDDLSAIREAASRSAELTQQLLAFARKQTVIPLVFQLSAAVEKILPMLRRLIGENITLQWESASGNTQIKIDPAQIDQILVNLCINARDAITGAGLITITISRCDLTASSTKLSKNSIEYVALSVTDDGSGIKENDLPHIFEPFYTTKEQGKGTGLGLSTVYGIIKQNNGRIDCKSEPGIGTTITTYLPLNRDTIAANPDVSTETETHQGHQTILIVEDEPGILKLCKLMLEGKGYKVLSAETPMQAITLADNYNDKIDLLLTDVVMPEMNGQDLAEIIAVLRPDMKILFMSGYTADAFGDTRNLHTEANFIRKPFTISSLTTAVNNTLNPGAPDSCLS